MLWSLSMCLKLNPVKFELVWFFVLLQCTELSTSSLLSPSSSVLEAGSCSTPHSLIPQLAVTSCTCLFHLRRIQQLYFSSDPVLLKTPIRPYSDNLHLTRLQNCLKLSYEAITPALCCLHWLLVSGCIHCTAFNHFFWHSVFYGIYFYVESKYMG